MTTIQEINLLLVEDNPGDARLIQEMLKESAKAHCAVSVAENLTLASSLIKNREFDIIILDLNLPESKGIDTLDSIIGSPAGMPPVIVLTGMDDEAVGMTAIERGAENYLVKGSITSAQLMRTIRYAIERKRLVRELEKSEEIFRQFMEHSPIYVFFKDAQLRSLRLSKNYETMLGKPIDEMLGKTMDELFPSDLAKRMMADDMRVLMEGKRVDIEEELNGRFYTTIKFPIYQEGKPLYIAGFTIDITEHKQMEDQRESAIMALQVNETRLSMALEVGDAGIWEWDVLNDTVRFDDRFHSMLGYTPGELPLTLDEWLPFHHPEDIPVWMPKTQAYLRGESPQYESEHRIRAKAGSWTWIFTRGKIIKTTPTGSPEIFMGIAMNVIERKQSEEKLERQLVELRRWHEVMMDREGRVIELKKEVNSLLGELGRPEKYGD